MKKDILQLFKAHTRSELMLPFEDLGIKAGFPSPAQDYVRLSLDLNSELVRHPASTFYARVEGDSLKDAGINHGDLLIIDRSLKPQNKDIAVCYVDGEFTVKIIQLEKNELWLHPANDSYKPIRVTAQNDVIIWGIVTHSVKIHR